MFVRETNRHLSVNDNETVNNQVRYKRANQILTIDDGKTRLLVDFMSQVAQFNA